MSHSGKISPNFQWMRCLAALMLVFFNALAPVNAQLPPAATPDSARLQASRPDTTARSPLEDSLGIRISADALPAAVVAEAADSAVMDMDQNLFYLYGNARVTYDDLKLEAGRVTFNQNNSLVTAAPLTDTLASSPAPRPTFTQGAETFSYDSLQYNFRSRRALVRNARTQYGEGFVFSQQVKRNPDQSIYGYQSLYTTCALDTPHFGIRAQKIKVIPNRVIASGPANIEIEHVPTPVVLPFGLFPISQTQRSGFRLPTYTFENQRGLGLTNGGYYFHLSEYLDLLLQTNIYTKGSYSLSGLSSYVNRYRFSGMMSAAYAFNKTGETYEPGASIQKDFNIQWRHQTDPKARPGVSFNASVNVGTSTFFANNSYETNQILNNQFQSNITFSKNWVGKPYNLTVSARHSQNTQSRQVDVTLPELNFYISQFNPFQRKNSMGSRWYEKITASYTVNATNQTSFTDTAFGLDILSFNRFRNGVKHSIPVSASYTVARFINLSMSANYNEYWLTQQIYRYYNQDAQELDTISRRGFFTGRDFQASMQLSTRIYGLKTFRRGRLAGIRHVLTPNVGLSYTPDYARAPFNYYYRTLLGPAAAYQYLSAFEGSAVGVPGYNQAGDFASLLNFGLNNNLQIKTRSSKDTVTGTRNITLIDALSFTGSYNLAADSFKWSPLAISFRTNIANILNLSGGAIFSPYTIDRSTGRNLPQTTMAAGEGLARFNTANVALSASFRSRQRSGNESRATAGNDYQRLMHYGGGYNDYVDFNIPWSLNVSYALTVNNRLAVLSGADSLAYSQNLMFNGDFNLTPRWKIGFSSGYDFEQGRMTFTSIDIYRDLHCWEMRLNTIPFGPRKSYNFTLNVKASILQDLRLLRRRDFRDAIY